MMDYLDYKLMFSSSFKTKKAFLSYLFCTLGNGIHLNLKGYIEGYKDAEFIIPENVEPLVWIYPVNHINAHMTLAGCVNKGFKEAVQYLIDCILITSDDIENIKPWKDNIHLLEELRDAPPIEDKYTTIEEGKDTFYKCLNDSTSTTGSSCNVTEQESVEKVWFFDAQWSDCPTFIEDEVRQLWADYELGNDNYFYKSTLNSELYERYPRIYLWLEHKGVKEGERVMIHWWW